MALKKYLTKSHDICPTPPPDKKILTTPIVLQQGYCDLETWYFVCNVIAYFNRF